MTRTDRAANYTGSQSDLGSVVSTLLGPASASPSAALLPPPAFSTQPPPAFSTQSPPAFSTQSPPAFSTQPPPAFSTQPPPAFSTQPQAVLSDLGPSPSVVAAMPHSAPPTAPAGKKGSGHKYKKCTWKEYPNGKTVRTCKRY
ncbi:MAG: hypothetical protein NXI02_30305 [Rhodobacteraceae bacterium]|nr:hypothetical protein [Paracoccaceae bacterium]